MSLSKYKYKYKSRLTVTLLASIVMALGTTACNRFQSADSLISEARQYQQKGDIAAAEIQLKNALQKDPDSMEARFLLGQVSLLNGDGPSAEKELRKAMSLGLKPEQVKPFLAQSLLLQNQFQKALDETATIADDPEVAPWRGNAYLGLGQTDKAKAAFEAALKVHPTLPVAMVGLARTALVDKDLPGALALTEQAIAKNPGNMDVLLFKANLLRDQGQYEPALAVLKQVLGTRPDSVEARVSKAEVEIRMKNFDAAREDVAAIQKSAPKNLVGSHMQAVLEFSQAKYADALASEQKVLAAAPDYMPGLLLSGAIQYNLGSMPQAELNLNRYLETNPNDPTARKLLASTLLKSGQRQRAMTVLDPVLRSSTQDAEALSLAGEISMANRDFNKASDYFEKAVTAAPNSANYRVALGLANLGRGDNATAISQLASAHSMDAKSPQAGLLLAAAQMRVGQFDQALATSRQLEKDLPDNPLLYNMQGVMYVKQGKPADARKAFDKALQIDPAYFPAVANLTQADLDQNKPDDAKKRLEAFLQKDKKNAQAMSALAGLALMRDDKAEAQRQLERAVAENPDSVAASVQLVKFLLQYGDAQKALTIARNLQAANAAEPTALEVLAQAQMATGDKAGALNNYQRLASLVPDSGTAQLNIASAQLANNDAAGAAESVRKALVLQPELVDAWLFQASLFMRGNEPDKTLALAKRMQKQRGMDAPGFELEGNVLTSQKKPDLAAKAYEQAYLADRNTPRLLMKLYGALVLAGREKDADGYAGQWFKAHPNDAAVHAYLGESYLARNQPKPAAEQFELALRAQPDTAGVLNNLAWTYQLLHDPRALPTAQKAVAAMPDSPLLQDTLGWILLQQGDTAKALPLLKKASAALPESMDIRFRLAQALAKSGDKASARAELDTILKSGKPFAQANEARALLATL